MLKIFHRVFKIVPSSPADIKLVMGGLHESGKSTILYFLKDGSFTVTLPTLGFNRSVVELEERKVHMWDLGST